MYKRQVAYFRELRPELGAFDGEAPEHVVYLARCTVASMLTIAGHVKAALRRGEIGEASVDAPRAPKFHVFMVPRTTLLCKQILEDELVLPYVTIQAYHLDFVCFDKDVLSLECDHCICDWNVHGDPTTLEFALAALLRLEQFFGAPRRIQAFGEAGKRVAKTYAIADWKLEQTRLRERGYFGDPDEPPMFGAKPPPYLYDDYADTRERRDVDPPNEYRAVDISLRYAQGGVDCLYQMVPVADAVEQHRFEPRVTSPCSNGH